MSYDSADRNTAYFNETYDEKKKSILNRSVPMSLTHQDPYWVQPITRRVFKKGDLTYI